MDYVKVYNQIIQRAKGRLLVGYVEKHHIVPKCLGGANDSTNLVNLTAREHFLCHWLLARMYPDNYRLVYAFNMMCFCVGRKQVRYTPSSRTVEEARVLFSQVAGKHLIGTKRPDQAKRNQLRKGVFKHSDMAKAKLRASNVGKKQAQETILKRVAKLKGQKRSKESVAYLKNLIWITNGVVTIRINKQELLPEGYWRGRLAKR